MTHTIAVDRPPDLPQLPFESILVTYPDGTSEPGRAYWTASEAVAAAISAIDNLPLAEWVCRTLNGAVLRDWEGRR